MKRSALLALITWLLSASMALAASSIVTTLDTHGQGITVATITCTAHTNGVFTTTSTGPLEGYLVRATTNPGTAPTTDYDITLIDRTGADVMGGTLTDRSATVTETVVPKLHDDGTDRVYGGVLIRGGLDVTIANNSVNSAVVVIYLFIERP